MPQKLRPDVDEYFLKIVKVVSERSTCIRRKLGAVAVIDKRIVATGYNGAASGVPDCLEIGCLRDQNNVPSGATTHICRAIHAEENVIIQAAIHGTSIKGATIYCTTSPCAHCARLLINAKIARFVYYVSYPNREAEAMFREAGIKLELHPEPAFDASQIKERVLAVDADTFYEAGYFTGFRNEKINDFYNKIRSRVRYIDREDAEVNDEWKQIIPYIVVHYKDKYLVTERLSKSGESRLKGAYSFGVGGHINPVDSGNSPKGNDVIERGMHREMAEEISAKKLKKIKLVGFVYDDNQDVSRHHIGFVYDAELGSEEIEILEKDEYKPYFVPKKDLPKYMNGKESWAELVYKHYIANDN